MPLLIGRKFVSSDLCRAGDDVEFQVRIAAVRESLKVTVLVIYIGSTPTAAEAAGARAILAANEDLEPVLDRFSWSLALDRLIPFARWRPNFKPGRIFDTRFFLADVGTGAIELAPDLGENTHLFRVTAHDALDQIERETLYVWRSSRPLTKLSATQNVSCRRQSLHGSKTVVKVRCFAFQKA